MKNNPNIIFKILILFQIALYSTFTGHAQPIDAKEIIRRADEKFRGLSSQGEISMTLVRPTWERTITFKTWSKGNSYFMVYVMAPAKDKGQVMLKRENEMWNWMPSVGRMIKLPPSMMGQGWMGSDITNDDLLKHSSIVEDYNHKLIGEEVIDGIPCYKIELIAKEDAVVIYDKIEKWVAKEEYFQLHSVFYDEMGTVVKTEHAWDVKQMGDRKITTQFEVIPVNKKGHKTRMKIIEMQYNTVIKDDFFTQKEMQRIR